MSMTLSMFALSEEEFSAMAEMEFDEFVEFASQPTLDLDKAWGAVGWLLKAEGLDDNRVLFGDMLEEGAISDVPPFFKTAEEVGAIAQLLAPLDEQRLRATFDSAALANEGVYPDVWGSDVEDEENWIVEVTIELIELYKQAAANGQFVVSLMA